MAPVIAVPWLRQSHLVHECLPLHLSALTSRLVSTLFHILPSNLQVSSRSPPPPNRFFGSRISLCKKKIVFCADGVWSEKIDNFALIANCVTCMPVARCPRHRELCYRDFAARIVNFSKPLFTLSASMYNSIIAYVFTIPRFLLAWSVAYICCKLNNDKAAGMGLGYFKAFIISYPTISLISSQKAL